AQVLIGPIPPGHFQEHGDFYFGEPLSNGPRRIASNDLVRLDVARHQRSRSDHRAVADPHARHDDRLRADPDVVAYHGVSRREITVGRLLETRLIGIVKERERADPVVPVSLVPGHDEGGSGPYGAEAADQQLVGLRMRQKKPRTVIEAVAVVIAGIVAVSPDDDVRMPHLLVQRNALEGAFEEVGHGFTAPGASWRAANGNRRGPDARNGPARPARRPSRQKRGDPMQVVQWASAMAGSYGAEGRDSTARIAVPNSSRCLCWPRSALARGESALAAHLGGQPLNSPTLTALRRARFSF